MKDYIEAGIMAVITGVFLGLFGAALVATAWILVCRYLRTRELDSDYEHVNHPRHGKTYQG